MGDDMTDTAAAASVSYRGMRTAMRRSHLRLSGMAAALAFASFGMTLGATLGASEALAQTNGPTKYYTGVAVLGDPVEVNTSALDKLGPPPDMRQLLRQPAVVLGAGSPVTQRGAPLNGRAPVSGLTANAPTSLLAAPTSAPRSGLVTTQSQGYAAAPRSGTSAPVSGLESTAPRVAALPPQAPAAPAPSTAQPAAAAPVPAKPEPVRVTTKPPPKPSIAATTPSAAPTTPKPTPAPAPAPKPVAAAPKPTPVPVKPTVTPEPAAVAKTPAKPAPASAPVSAPKPAPTPAPVPAKVEIPKIEAPVVAAAETPTAASVAEAPKATANVPTPAPSTPQVASVNPNAVIESGGKTSIQFGSTSSELPAGSEAALDRMAERLNANPDMRVQLMGYASNSGETASESRRLSLFRALAVRTYLIKKGVRSTRMDVRALGNKTDGGDGNRVDVILPDSTG